MSGISGLSNLPQELLQSIVCLVEEKQALASTCHSLATAVHQTRPAFVRCLLGEKVPSFEWEMNKHVRLLKRLHDLDQKAQANHILPHFFSQVRVLNYNYNCTDFNRVSIFSCDSISNLIDYFRTSLQPKDPQQQWLQLQHINTISTTATPPSSDDMCLLLLDFTPLKLSKLSILTLDLSDNVSDLNPSNIKMINSFLNAYHEQLTHVSIITEQNKCLNNTSMKALATCSNLRDLALPEIRHISKAALLQVAQGCHALERLNLHDTEMTDAVVGEFARHCPNLRIVVFSKCPNLTMQAVTSLTTLEKVESIYLQGCSQLKDKEAVLDRFLAAKKGGQTCQQLTRLELYTAYEIAKAAKKG